jgi:hypothetical protein
MEMLTLVLFLPLIVCVRCTENSGSSKDEIKLLMEEVKYLRNEISTLREEEVKSLKNKMSKLENQCVLKSDMGKII